MGRYRTDWQKKKDLERAARRRRFEREDAPKITDRQFGLIMYRANRIGLDAETLIQWIRETVTTWHIVTLHDLTVAEASRAIDLLGEVLKDYDENGPQL